MNPKNKKKTSFFKRLFFCFTIISIVPVIILGTLIYTISSNVILRNVEYQSRKTVNNATLNLERTIEEYKSALSYFCMDDDIIRKVSSNQTDRTSNTSIYQKMYILLAGKSPHVTMHLIKADGSFQISTSIIPEVYHVKGHSDWGVFRKLNKSNDVITYPNRYVSYNGKKYCLAIAHSIKQNNKNIAYAIIDIPVDVIQTALNAVNVSFPIQYTVVDKNNYLLYNKIFDTQNETFLDSNFRNQMVQSQQNNKFYLEKPKRFVTWDTTSSEYPLRVISSIPMELVVMNNNYIMITTFAVALISILLCVIFSPILIRRLIKPLNAIVQIMNKVQNGDTSARVVFHNNDEFGYIGRNLNSMLDRLNELFTMNLEKRNRLRLAELKSLYAQINPHFLYNTLDSIKWLAKLSGVDDIVMIVSQLGKLLKNNIHNQKESVLISEEIGIIKSYLYIQKIRYGDKFNVAMQVDNSIMSCIIPKFIIQPIVENALIHGIEDKVGKAYLIIRGWKQENKLIFEVEDDGVGMSEEKLNKVHNLIHVNSLDSDSIGIANVDKRIKLYYGKDYGLDIKSKENKGTITRITIPFSGEQFGEK